MAWGRRGARPGGRSPGAASSGARDLPLFNRELTALKEADTGGQVEVRASRAVAAPLKCGGDDPCDLVTLVKALPGVGSSLGGVGGAPGDSVSVGGGTFSPLTRLTLGTGEGTSEARGWSWAPVRKATSKVLLVGEV